MLDATGLPRGSVVRCKHHLITQQSPSTLACVFLATCMLSLTTCMMSSDIAALLWNAKLTYTQLIRDFSIH